MGCNNLDTDYRAKGLTGGEKQHLLKEEEIPPHQHRVKDYVQKVKGYNQGGTEVLEGGGTLDVLGDKVSSGVIKYDEPTGTAVGTMQWIDHSTEKEGYVVESHENRPPYYVLAYIMRAR